MDSSKVRVAREWPIPSSVKEPQRFLSFAKDSLQFFYRRFIKNYTIVVAPLTLLLCGKHEQ